MIDRRLAAALNLDAQPRDHSKGCDVPEAKALALVIDDDPGVRLMVETTLEAAGIRVIEAVSAEGALELLDEIAPDIILCDVVMPGMDGFEFCSVLRTHAAGARVPVVMLTGLDDTDSVDKAFARGATDFIVKPIVWPLLPHRVRYVLRASRALDDLARSEERYALAARGANDGLWDWDLQTNIVYYSPRWKSMLGFEEAEIGDTPQEWLRRLHPEDAMRVRAEFAAHLSEETAHFECEHRVRASDGDYRWVVARGLAVRGPAGEAVRIAGSQTDVTQRKLAEEQLVHDAFHDTLTSLPNRTLFLDRLEHCIDVARRRAGYCFAVLFIDLDRFKVINDSLGHILGDRFLVEIANRLRSSLRRGDTLARLGGDEFTFLLEDITDVSDVTRMAQRIQTELQRPMDLEGQDVVSGASIGVAFSTTGYERPEDMLRDADAAMYRAKASGRARYEIFDAEMHAHAVETLQVESELRGAIRNDQIVVHYQPITCVRTDEIQGFEALVRWQHATRGLLGPESFLAVAEDTHLIVPIGRHVMREACQQLVTWQTRRPEAKDWFVAVNLSGRELAQPDIVESVRSILESSEMKPGSLKIEITEGSLIENNARALDLMNQLRALGVQLSIDDFGTGYSSLNYLHRFPFDVLKIDRSFVTDLDSNPERLEIVRAVIELAHNLGLRVVAEGTETESVMQQLRGLPCEYAQGHSILEPRLPVDIEDFMDRARSALKREEPE